MSTESRSLRTQLCHERSCLDRALRARIGISVRTYKALKLLTQLVGAGAGIYAMSLGADPMTSFALIAAILMGPEAAEAALTQQTGSD